MVSKHMKRCSTSLVIRGMQVKTTSKYHFTLSGMTINKGGGGGGGGGGEEEEEEEEEEREENKSWQGCGEIGTPMH